MGFWDTAYPAWYANTVAVIFMIGTVALAYWSYTSYDTHEMFSFMNKIDGDEYRDVMYNEPEKLVLGVLKGDLVPVAQGRRPNGQTSVSLIADGRPHTPEVVGDVPSIMQLFAHD